MAVNRDLQSILKSFRPIGKGDPVHAVAGADRMNALQDAVKLLARGDHINAGTGIKKRTGHDGLTMLTADFPKVYGSGLGPFPWQVTVGAGLDAGVGVIRVRPGTVNGALPSNPFETFDISTAPGDTYYVVIDVTTDGLEVTDVTLSVDGTPPDPIGTQIGFPPSYFEFPIGIVVGGTVFQLVYQLLQIVPLAAITVPKSNPVVGQPFFDVRYTWQIFYI